MRDWGLTNEGTGETISTDDPDPVTMHGIPGYDPADRDDSDDSDSSSTTATTTSSGGVPSGGNHGGSGIVMDDSQSQQSTYDPTTGDDNDPSTGTVTTGGGQTEEIDLGTDRGQDVINSPVVDPESDDVTGSGSNPDGVQRTTDLSGSPWNDAAENARAGRWGPALKLGAIALGAVVLGGVGLAAAGGDD